MTGSENVCYIPMALARHAVKDVARLIYQSAPTLFTLMFGLQAIACLAALVGRSHNRFSHQYIYVAEIDGKVVGIVTFVPSSQLNHETDYRETLNVSQRLWLKLVQYLILQHVLQHNYPEGTFYIGKLDLATEYRNRGIGRQLLRHCIAKATRPSTIFISVDIDNLRAQKLYESLGFEVVATKTMQLFGTIGSRILSLPCTN